MKNSWLFPYRPFDVAHFLARIQSPRLLDHPEIVGWVTEAAQEANLRPEWLLMTMQKEQSFLTRRAGSTGWQRALDFTLGYGALEGGTDLQQYKGVCKQIYGAARGIRGYLTPGTRYDVTGWPGTRRTFGGESGTVDTLVEAVCLQYTPHWSTLVTVENLWRTFKFEDGEDNMQATAADVANIARQIVGAYASGRRGTVTIGRVTFNLSDVAMCSRFVRECYEAAAGTAEQGPLAVKYFGGDARETEKKLRANGARSVTLAEANPGDILCFNHGSGAGKWGHIGLFMGGETFAENTSSPERGPGFVLSTLAEIGHERVSGVYQIPEFDAPAHQQGPGPARLVVLLPGHENHATPLFYNGQHWLQVWDVARMFGVTLHDRRATDEKLYFERPGGEDDAGQAD